MLYPRLVLAKQLLSEEGVIFCSIDDRNQAYLKCLFDDVFGEQNFLLNVLRQTKTTTNDAKTGVNIQHEYCLVYAKNYDMASLLYGEKDFSNYKNLDNDPNGVWISDNPSAKSGSMANNYFAVKNPYTGHEDYPPVGRYWIFSKNTIQKHIENGNICFKKIHKENERGFIFKRYLKDLKTTKKTFDSLQFTSTTFLNSSGTKELKALNLVEYFKYPKPVTFIKGLLQTCLNSNGIFLDFFAGSGTTGQAVLELNNEDGGNRTFILCTNNEITDLNPHGIAYDVTTKRLKRVMTGECYDGTKNFEWIQKNSPLGGNLEVYDIAKVSNIEQEPGKSAFDVIDEKCYGEDFSLSVEEKIKWVCENFAITQKYLQDFEQPTALNSSDVDSNDNIEE